MTTVAIVVHTFYEDLFNDIIVEYLDRIDSVQFKLYITCTQDNKKCIQQRLESAKYEYYLLVCSNHGRDVLPFLKILPKVISDGCEIVIKVHTKKSPHRADGNIWLKDFLSFLLTDISICNALSLFNGNPNLGMLAPEKYIAPMGHYFLLNSENILYYSNMLGVSCAMLNEQYFVAGNMFYARVSALIPLLNLNITAEDFDPERGQTDGTIAHALERIFSLSVFVAQYKLGYMDMNGNFTVPEPLSCEQLNHINTIKENIKFTNLRESNVSLTKQNSSLDQTVSNLNQTVSNLNQIVSNLNQIVFEQKRQIEEIFSSTSWRITSSLRKVGLWCKRGIRIWRLLNSYRQNHGGAEGLFHLFKRTCDYLMKGGLSGLRDAIRLREVIYHDGLAPATQYVLPLEEIDLTDVVSHQDIAVHAHIYYPDLAPELRCFLENIPQPFQLYVTTDAVSKAENIKASLANMVNVRELDIRVVPNRGRDIAPMIVELGEILSHHEIVLHIHTKRSPHNPKLKGWRRYLMQSLLGKPGIVAAILDRFEQDKLLGVLHPQPYSPVVPLLHIGGNAAQMSELLRRAGRCGSEIGNINTSDFPAGFMLWFRGNAIKSIVDIGLKLDDFDDEAGQDDSTMAHAIERMLLYFGEIDGYHHQVFLPVHLLSANHPGAVPVIELPAMLSSERAPLHIIFDHNIGGGANHYCLNLINSIISANGSALRIYYDDNAWFVEWISADDGMIFVETDAKVLFDALAGIRSEMIIINSLYEYPEIDRIIECITTLANKSSLPIKYKAHDFYAICPSQHLVDKSGHYCAVPEDINACNSCLHKNTNAHWVSGLPVEIINWRRSFLRLFEVASTVSVFDQSSVDILKLAFHVDDAKLRVEPHEHKSFKNVQKISLSGPLHIGVFGTLTQAKGSDVINGLADYILKNKLHIPLTVVGRSVVPTIAWIRVLGAYSIDNLSQIVQREGINVVIMPSIIPETFSYTISEAMEMKLPIVAFDIGAQGRRVKSYKWGQVVPLDSPPEILFKVINEVYLSATKELS